jgi:translation initiation factor 4G
LCRDVAKRISEQVKLQNPALEAEQAAAADKADKKNTPLENFRRILLNRCQNRFQEGVERPEAEPPQGLSDEERLDWQHKEKRYRGESKGNIRFIAHLYKFNMLSERIMHKVIKSLLIDTDHSNDKNFEQLEVLCTMLQTAGRKLDRPETSEYIKSYLSKLSVLSTSYPMARIRFLMMNVLEMHANGWKQRHKEAVATKITGDSAASEARSSTTPISRTATAGAWGRAG